jgi:Archaeal fructose-1,6-bisphosphatase and related enzymes of inositol monophosphatase family
MTAIDFSSFVDQLATTSGDTILPFFRTALAIENKKAGGFDPVTEADRAAEQSMRTLIRKQFPGHGILGEEYGSERTDAEYVWVLDPIDGTKSFISGVLAWGTLIGLMRFGEPVFGMMNQPFTREASPAMEARRAIVARPATAICTSADARASTTPCCIRRARC